MCPSRNFGRYYCSEITCRRVEDPEVTTVGNTVAANEWRVIVVSQSITVIIKIEIQFCIVFV